MTTSQNARINMVKQQLRTGDVLDETILSLFEKILRQNFVPSPYEPLAYSDLQIPLPHNQRMLTPLEEGKILQALKLTGSETVLEIGTGTGFFTTLLSKLSKKVISVEVFQEFTDYARQKLHQYRCDNVELITGDGSRGWLDEAPYDVVIFTGSLKKLTETQRLQIIPGGKLFAIVGTEPIMQGLLHSLDHSNNWHVELVFETSIPPLIDQSKSQEFVF